MTSPLRAPNDWLSGGGYWPSSLAANQGVGKSTINNIWQSHNIKPHRVKTFKLSRDAKFLEKLTDVVGLYLNPPDQAPERRACTW